MHQPHRRCLAAGLQSALVLALLCVSSLASARGASALSGRLLVWVDDARTRQVEVEPIDFEEIADPSSFGFGAGTSVGEIGISFGWRRERGIAYDRQVQEVLDQLEELVGAFNGGELSLETYHRRSRRILGALDHVRMAAREMQTVTQLRKLEARVELDEALGMEPPDTTAARAAIQRALDGLRRAVEAVEQPTGDHSLSAPSLLELLELGQALQVSARRAERLAAELADGGQEESEPTEFLEIRKYRDRDVIIRVPRLDVEGLVDDLSSRLTAQLKFSAPLVTEYLGPQATWILDRKGYHDEAAQLLIVRYRRLCEEYNGGLLTQEDYVERLADILAAEEEALDMGRKLLRIGQERKEAMSERGRERGQGLFDEDPFGDGSYSPGGAAERRRRALDTAGQGEKEEGTIASRARADVEQMARWEQLVERSTPAPSRHATLEVDVDDAGTRRRRVEPLNTDRIAQSYRTRLGLHISLFNLGPELAWTRERGLEYDRLAQELIVKTKLLCAEFNAGQMSIETYQRRRDAIDASVAAAGRVREELGRLSGIYKGLMGDELDRLLGR